jgi:thiol:disulfide interchange protein
MKSSRAHFPALVALFLLGAPAAPGEGEAPASGRPQGAAPKEVASATAVLARARAAAGTRGVFLAFHASWCGWCRTLEKLTTLPATKGVFDRHYVVAWLTVDERASRKELENPGADEMRSRLGLDGVALPFYVVFDPAGKVVGSSVRPDRDGKKENIGFPATPEEIRAFLALFRSGAPGLTADEEQALVNGIAALARR